MKVYVIVVGSSTHRYLDLRGVPRVGDLLWIDTDVTMPTLTKFYVQQVEWFERYGGGDEPGVVVRCSEAP